ncbi:tyrosine-type recombinase/integrase [Chryseobacterium shigense]|uniref:Site-specific recombinase XerD n=1 Tax=Chryseobacterium shigense TaxID=297244 RepID=A0A841NIQ8_9FLAO|nr:tyrosine-type recombinase/integrase [Chryseobacterium shigense]MBB6371139.1 site-specific recombinase XerD [Chryseobacterium shigense]
MSNKEIERIVNLKNFASSEEEFARDIWELLYRCNGINFVDLLRLRWEQQNGRCFVFFRKKTEKTQKNLKKDVVVPIDRKLELLLQKVGDRKSKFVLDILKEGYSEQNFDYYNRKLRKQINYSLSELSEKLELSVPLKLKTARDSYASVLKRSGVSIDKISEILSHSNTNHSALDSMDLDTVFEINSHLI